MGTMEYWLDGCCVAHSILFVVGSVSHQVSFLLGAISLLDFSFASTLGSAPIRWLIAALLGARKYLRRFQRVERR